MRSTQFNHHMKIVGDTLNHFISYVVSVVCILCLATFDPALAQRPHKAANKDLQLADPHIFYHDGIYYLYGTGSSEGFKVYTSRDLKEWDGPAGATDGFALKKGSSFGHSRFWAPQVFLWNGRFYFAYAADEHIAIAEGENPLGPFRQATPLALKAQVKQIDPFVFIDDDGRKYLYHVRVANGGNRIFVAEMTNDLSAIKTETLKECISATEGWENTANDKWSVAEGPTVLKHDGLYYLIYSANHFRSSDYAVGYAVSKHPLGPWKKFKLNPILSRKDVGVNGTGHGDVVADAQGNMYYVFHTHQSDSVVGPRRTALVKIGFEEGDEDRLKVEAGTFQFLRKSE